MLVLLLVSLVGSCLLPQIARFMERGAGLVIALFPLGLFAAFISMSDIVERGWVRGDGRNWAPSVGLDLTLRLDGFSFLFCLLITGIGTLVIVYSGGYLTSKPRYQRIRFFTLILLFMTAMLGTVLADNLLLMVTMWEATSILSFLLIGFDGKSARARRAALMALQVTAGGGLALLAAVAMIAQVLGTFSLAETIERTPELVASSWAGPIILAVMIAGFTKSAQFPFHFWLPNAMQAPTPASAFLHSATMVKLGVYLLARFEPAIAATIWGRNVIIAVACITMLVAAVQALRAESFKAALAYSTIASLGILMLLVGLDGPTATVAMIGFLIAHALYKAALFFCAGSVLHMTGQGSLRALGGLARRMPLTAIACVGASLSMAGIPPFFGFITKEFLFQAQIESSWESVPIAIAVLVNAVMVAVASVVTLRPFFLKPSTTIEFKHRESLSLGLPPLLLSLLGLFLSLNPGWIERVVVSPAVTAVYRRPIPVDVAVWHGVTPMLLLSALVVVVGVAIAVFWKHIHLFLREHGGFERFGVERLWETSQRALPWLAARAVAWTEHSDLRVLLGVVLSTITGITTWSIVAVGTPLRIDTGETPHLADIAIAAAAVAGALVAARSQHLVTTMLAVGLSGFAVAIVFMTGGAPDLAITQFIVEALLVVLLTAMLTTLPLTAARTRNARQRIVDAGLAGALALILLLATLDAAATVHGAPASDFFGRMSYVAGRGHNVVNVILVDFRAFDTLGETTVIAAAALVGAALFGSRREPSTTRHDVHFGFASAAGPLFALLLASSVVILWRGHDQPGGGFIGGLVAALAFAILSLARGPTAAARTLRVAPTKLVGAGLLLAAGSGLPGMIGDGAYLTQLWWEPGRGLPKLGTTLAFDIGVYLVVLGAVLTYLFGLQKEAAR
jgi:multicomponent Na+:H+ antiporter subunit A